MPTTPSAPHPGLFVSLINDASPFPPAALPVREALARHREHRAAWYADLIGPLLVGVAHVPDLIEALSDEASEGGEALPLRVGLAARPGTEPGDIAAALRTLAEHPGLEVVSLDRAFDPGWAEEPHEHGRTLNLEVGREHREIETALDSIDDEGIEGVQAKFRTGGTPKWRWPEEKELAGFIHQAVESRVPFVLTGGLHHAIRGRYEVTGNQAPEKPQEQHGLLNVLLATWRAAQGADVEDITATLRERSSEILTSPFATMTAVDVSLIRGHFSSYGCCDVTDPVRELKKLHLIKEKK